ncbi:MAG: hypothetical protein AAGF76_11525 [Pseudomonadota bacterium]
MTAVLTPGAPWLRDPGPRKTGLSRGPETVRGATVQSSDRGPDHSPEAGPRVSASAGLNAPRFWRRWGSALPRLHRGTVDPVAFAAALVLAPIVVGIGGILLVIPPFAVVTGLPAYLLAGAPLFWLTAAEEGRRQLAEAPARVRTRRFALAGLVANLFTPVALALGYDVIGAFDRSVSAGDVATLLLFSAMGCVFAPILGAVFGKLYALLARPPLRTGLPHPTPV